MADVPITLTCGDYARVMPLATGQVKPQGITLSMILGSHGSWPARAEMLRRAVQDPSVHGGEWSMAFPYATPWLEAELEETEAVMGADFHAYGFEQNHAQIEMFAGEAFRLGLTSRHVTPEQYFEDYLQGR